MAKKKSAKKLISKLNISKLNISKQVKRNVLVGVVVVAIVVVIYYLLASENGILVDDDDDDNYLQSQEDLIENLPQITGQSYFGYLKEGYIVNILFNGVDKRIELKSLNEDYTVDMVMDRAYNLEIGETVLADYNYDGAADVGFTLEGVDYYNNRFSATITYFGELPEQIVTG